MGPHTEDAAGVLRALLLEKEIMIQPAVATRHALGSLRKWEADYRSGSQCTGRTSPTADRPAKREVTIL
jgi:hypothetical protein